MVAEVKDGTVSLPIGKIQGVCQGSEFSTFAPSPGIGFRITHVDDLACSANISSAMEPALQRNDCQVVPSRWSFGEQALNILVDAGLGPRFQESLSASLHRRIASSINIGEVDGAVEQDISSMRLALVEGNIKIYGPDSWIGYSGPVRGLEFGGEHNKELAAKTAIALSHLARFRQVLHLKGLAESTSMPFEVVLESKTDAAYPGPFPNRHEHRFTFRNTGEDGLFVAVISLGPGFNIKQLYPPSISSKRVLGEKKSSFSFTTKIPEKLESAGSADGNLVHLDIIRTVVTQGEEVSWMSLELPHVWNASQVELQPLSSAGRDAGIKSEFRWWVQDREIHTVSS